MMYDITGGIEKGIHYTQFIEKVEGEEEAQGMKPKESAVKSHGETETTKVDTE